MDRTSASVTSTGSSSAFRSGSSAAKDEKYQPTGSVTTLSEAAAVFDNVSQRANRCSLQLATYKSHEQTYRRFLLERALPAADAALKERDDVMNRHDEEYGNANLRLKGVPVSHSLGSPVTRRRNHSGDVMKATDDPVVADLVEKLKTYSQKHGQKSAQ